MMQRYIAQLIEDLMEAANNPPSIPYFEPPPHLIDNPVVAELALIPFKTIEEWTGIKRIAFPDMYLLSMDQTIQITAAIFKLLDSLNVELMDKPADIPPEILYDVLIDNWDYPVQYLPSSGFDLELCSGNPATCPYGEYCDCGTDWSEEESPPSLYDPIDPGSKLPF